MTRAPQLKSTRPSMHYRHLKCEPLELRRVLTAYFGHPDVPVTDVSQEVSGSSNDGSYLFSMAEVDVNPGIVEAAKPRPDVSDIRGGPIDQRVPGGVFFAFGVGGSGPLATNEVNVTVGQTVDVNIYLDSLVTETRLIDNGLLNFDLVAQYDNSLGTVNQVTASDDFALFQIETINEVASPAVSSFRVSGAEDSLVDGVVPDPGNRFVELATYQFLVTAAGTTDFTLVDPDPPPADNNALGAPSFEFIDAEIFPTATPPTFRIVGTPPPGTFVSRVWEDVNSDGLQNGGELGIDGVTVNLLDGGGGPTGISAVTSGGGLASLNAEAGNYIIEYISPSGSIFSPQDVGSDDTIDSDADPATGRTAVITIASGQTIDHADAGLIFIAPTVTSVLSNEGLVDPPDLPGKGPQPTSWSTQQSELRNIVVSFSHEMATINPADLVLTNLGVNAPVDADVVVPIQAGWLSQTNLPNPTLTITVGNLDLADGVYQLDILPTATDLAGEPLDGNGDGNGGDAFGYLGSVANGFYELTGDWNGSGGVNVLDFATYGYWFNQDLPTAPGYVDPNDSGGLNILDFAPYAANFNRSIVEPLSGLSSLQWPAITTTVTAGSEAFGSPEIGNSEDPMAIEVATDRVHTDQVLAGMMMQGTNESPQPAWSAMRVASQSQDRIDRSSSVSQAMPDNQSMADDQSIIDTQFVVRQPTSASGLRVSSEHSLNDAEADAVDADLDTNLKLHRTDAYFAIQGKTRTL